MKKNKKIILKFIIFMIFFGFSLFKTISSFGMQNYYNPGFVTGLVTATNLNLRSGPGTNYPVIKQISKNQYIRGFAGIGDWYVVQIEGDYIGAVNKKYIKPIYPDSNNNTSSSNQQSNTNTTTSDLTKDELEVFNLINEERRKNGLSPLKIDPEVQRVARIKAQDMVNNNYFSHTSPTYGSPFDMLNSFKILYKSAGENIAGNSSNSAAVTAWMNSSGHRANILNSGFNYTGIGVVNGSQYGKIYVQMFIGK